MKKPSRSSDNRVLAEFLKGYRRYYGKDIPPGQADCAYWMKHHEAAATVACILRRSQQADLNSETQDLLKRVALKVAKQWNGYEAAENEAQRLLRQNGKQR